MCRLAELEHHEVRDIDDIIDRTDLNALNSRAQPIGTRPNRYIVDLPGGVKRTLARRGNPYATCQGATARRAVKLRGTTQFISSERRNLARQPEMTQQVAAVRRDFDIENGVARKKIDNRRANFCIRRQNQKAGRIFAQA